MLNRMKSKNSNCTSMKSIQSLRFFSPSVVDQLKSKMISSLSLTPMNKTKYDKQKLPNPKFPFHQPIFQATLSDRREKVQQKHDEAKSLKDGIDRRSRLVNSILRKYFSNEQYDDYEHFIRMKSTLLMDEKDLEENIQILEKQIEIFNQFANSNETSSKHFSNISSQSIVLSRVYLFIFSLSLRSSLHQPRNSFFTCLFYIIAKQHIYIQKYLSINDQIFFACVICFSLSLSLSRFFSMLTGSSFCQCCMS